MADSKSNEGGAKSPILLIETHRLGSWYSSYDAEGEVNRGYYCNYLTAMIADIVRKKLAIFHNYYGIFRIL